MDKCSDLMVLSCKFPHHGPRFHACGVPERHHISNIAGDQHRQEINGKKGPGVGDFLAQLSGSAANDK